MLSPKPVSADITLNIGPVTFDDTHLSRGMVHALGKHMAKQLRGVGVGPGSIVGVCLQPHSVMILPSMLAIFMAGAAMMALEPRNPDSRLLALVQEANPTAIITSQSLANERSLHDLVSDVVCVPEDGKWMLDADEEMCEQSPSVNVDGRSVAYVIATSGTTSKRSKLVPITHMAWRNTVKWFMHWMEDRPVVGQMLSLQFDASMLEYGHSLLTAASTRLWSRTNSLAQFLDDSQTTLATIPPALLSVVKYTDLKRPSLHWICAGGEKTTVEMIANWCHGDCRYIQGYGPSEDSIMTSAIDLRPGDRLPIGQAIPNKFTTVLDSKKHSRGIHLDGVLHIGGLGLSTGYHGRPSLTAQKFTPHHNGTRLYDTGDVVRCIDTDGTLEYVGRTDFQLKVRDHRVEASSVENTLLQHPHVNQSIVVMLGTSTMVAYIGVTDQAIANTQSILGDMYDMLSTQLPVYAIPSSIVAMDRLPVTLNGKVDRRKLPHPSDDGVLLVRRAYAEATTAEELKLQTIFTDVLGVDVGVDDSFFQVGGDSILSMRVVAAVNDDPSLPFTITSTDVFKHQTVRALAAACSSRADEDDHVDESTKAIYVDLAAITDDQESMEQMYRVLGATARANHQLTHTDALSIITLNANNHLVIDRLVPQCITTDTWCVMIGAGSVTMWYVLHDDHITSHSMAHTLLQSVLCHLVYHHQLPMTSMAMGMIYHSQQHQDDLQYQEHSHLYIENLRNINRYVKAWKDTVAAHMLLHSHVEWPWMVVDNETAFSVTQVSIPHVDQLDAVRSWCQSEPMDLNQSPLIRLLVVHVDGDHPHAYHISISFHHCILDGWSISLRMGEIEQRYRGIPVPSLANDYRSFTFWQQNQPIRPAKEYFQSHMRGKPGTMVQDSIGGVDPSFNDGDEHIRDIVLHCPLPSSQSSSSVSVTLNSRVLSAWALTLAYVTGSMQGVTFGMTLSGRPEQLEDVDRLIELFICTLPLHVDTRSHQSISELLSGTHQHQYEVQQFPHVGLSDVAKWCDHDSANDMFDTLSVFENYPVADVPEDDERYVIHGEGSREETNYPVLLATLAEPDRSCFHLNIDTRRIRDGQRIGDYFQHVMTMINTMHPDPGVVTLGRAVKHNTPSQTYYQSSLPRNLQT